MASVACLDIVRVLILLAAQKRWILYQLDVKSAFLNQELKQEVCIEQLEGFIVEGQEDKVYLLKKGIVWTEASLKILV